MQYLKNRTLHALRRLRAIHRFRNDREFSLDLPIRGVRRILVKNGLGFAANGNPSWFYAAFDLMRNQEDELTKAALRYVVASFNNDARILGTGCGTGWMLFWLARRGFSNIEGFDYLGNIVDAAKEIAALGSIGVKLWQADGFDPKLEGEYDTILVLHWLYSAWMGNYGNKPRRSEERETLLNEFLSRYSKHVRPNGQMLLELIDAASDFLEPPSDFYPVRHSSEQVARCAATAGFVVQKQIFNFRYGHLPRMLYVLRKPA
jgi:SAM-dependent methyltransferase